MGSDQKLIVNLTRGNLICEHVVIADRPARRMRGLLGRRSLPAGEGMLLQPAPSIHTAFMRFAFDAVFMDGTLKVVKVVERLPPWRLASARRALAVLELAEGEIASRGIGLGDQLGVVEVSDALGAVEDNAGWSMWSWTSLVDGASEVDEAPNGKTSDQELVSAAHTGQGAVLTTRVLVVGADRRFRSVAAALLTRRGCAVTLGDRTANLAELARRSGAEVVVLDAGMSLTEAAHGAAQIETLDPPVGIVVVGEEAERSFSAMPVLPKWGSFNGLFGAIEHARPARARRLPNGLRA